MLFLLFHSFRILFEYHVEHVCLCKHRQSTQFRFTIRQKQIIKQIKANYTKKRNRVFLFYILLIMLESAIVDILQRRKEKKKKYDLRCLFNISADNQEKFYLYIIVSVSAGILLFLGLIIGRLLISRHRAKRDAKFHANETLPNGFTDDISEIDADIDLTTPVAVPMQDAR